MARTHDNESWRSFSWAPGPATPARQATNGAGYAFHYTPDGRLISSELPEGTSRYYLTDVVGSVVAVSGASSFTAKYAYDPCGNTRSTSGGEAGSQPFRYTGAYTDTAAGGLYKMEARYYDPSSGRFTQPDPSGQEMNLFSYVSDNPVNFEDPTGLITRRNVYGAAYGAVAGSALGAITGTTVGAVGGRAVGAVVGAVLADGIGAIPGCGVGALDGISEGGQAGFAIGLVGGGFYDYHHGANDPIFG